MRKQIPNMFTLLNLLSGCLSILFLFSGDMVLASWMIGLAAVLDFLDGFLARLLKAASDMGKMLDSLADIISFGVAPGFILFRMMQLWGDTTPLLAYIALLVPLLSAVRLAIFSVDDRQQMHFIGIPTPLNALMIASLPLVLIQYDDGTLVHTIFSDPWFLYSLAIVSSILLVAPIRILALKFKSFTWKNNLSLLVLAAVFIILAIGIGFLAMPVMYVVYILISLIDKRIQQ